MAFGAIDPGRLRMQFRLETNAPRADDQGGYADRWSLIALVWGDIERIRADDPLRAAAGEQMTDATILLRADPRVQPAMRLANDCRAYIVRTVHDPDGTGRYLRCQTTADGQS